MSESNRKPEDEEEERQLGDLSEDAAIALLTSEPAPAPEPPAPETPPAPEGQQPPAPESREELPSWLASIPQEERAAVAERFLATLTDQERANLPTVNQMVNNAANWAAQQTQQALTSEQNEDTRNAELVNDANALYGDIVNQALTADQLTDRLSTYADVAADTRQSELNDDIQESIWASARLLGLKQIPGDVAAAAANADGWGAAIHVYNEYFLGTAYNAGVEAGKRQSGDTAKADAAVEKARLRDEIIAELTAEGRIRSDVPPSLGGGVSGRSGPITLDDNASEEDLLAAAAANIGQMKAAARR